MCRTSMTPATHSLPTRAPASFRAASIAGIIGLMLASLQGLHAEPWNLPTYRVCRQVRLSGIDHEVSGVTYSPVTNSLWVVTRRPPVIGEYSVTGRKLRTVRHRNLVDPEGITWMFDYTFAVAEEGRGRGYAITVMDAEPWRREVRVRKKIDLSRLPDQNSNNGLEAVAFDPKHEVFYVTQEQSPMRIWRVALDGRSRQILAGKPSGRFYGRDFAGMHYRAGDNGLFILSEAGEVIHKVGFDGVTQGEPLRGIKGRMPEGLTFTPDGALMIVAGEPNEMFFYTSVGTCDWRPGATLPDYPDEQYDDMLVDSDKPDRDQAIVLSLKLEGITVDQFVPLAQVYYKAALGISAYGGSLDVLPLVSMPRVTSDDAAIYTEVHIKVRDGEAAEALQTTVEHAIETGAFYTTLTSLGFPASTITVAVVEEGTDGAVELVDGPDGAPYTSGFEGYVTLRLTGVSEDSLTPLNQLYLRSAVAASAYGSTQAHTWVAITDTNQLQGGAGAKVRILAVTLEHARLLVARVTAAIASGELLAELRALQVDFPAAGGIELGAISFRKSEVPPEDFPTSELAAMAEQSASFSGEDSVEWIYAFADDSTPASSTLSPANIAISAACAAVGAAVAAAIITVARRRSAQKRACLNNKESDDIEMEERQRRPTGSVFGSPSRAPASRFPSPQVASRLKSASRVPRSPSVCNLLNDDDSGSPDDGDSSSSHSRQGSVTLGADSFMQRLQAAGCATADDAGIDPLSGDDIDLEAAQSAGEDE